MLALTADEAEVPTPAPAPAPAPTPAPAPAREPGAPPPTDPARTEASESRLDLRRLRVEADPSGEEGVVTMSKGLVEAACWRRSGDWGWDWDWDWGWGWGWGWDCVLALLIETAERTRDEPLS